MKKFIALALVIIMMAAIAVPAMAEDKTMDTNTTSATTDVTFGVTDKYTVTVPALVDFATALETTAEVKATGVVVAGNKQLEVKIASATTFDYANDDPDAGAVAKEAWKMVETSQNGSTAVPYEVALTDGGTALVNNDVVLTVVTNEAATTTKTQTLYFSTEGTTQSGNYADVLTFSTAVVDYVAPQD